MKIIKILNKTYDEKEIENNSKTVRKWFIIKQIKKEELSEKYYTIENVDKVDSEYKEIIGTISEDTREFYGKYLDENWKETFPIMKDVSRYQKIRPTDGVEFCILI